MTIDYSKLSTSGLITRIENLSSKAKREWNSEPKYLKASKTAKVVNDLEDTLSEIRKRLNAHMGN